LAASMKKAVSDKPYNDLGMIGAFYFRKAGYFYEAMEFLYKNNIRVNGEFYVDSCIDILRCRGLNVKAFEVDYYAGWGNPESLRTYEYWQSFFHKCPRHPYRLEKDTTINRDKIGELDEKYRNFQ